VIPPTLLFVHQTVQIDRLLKGFDPREFLEGRKGVGFPVETRLAASPGTE